MKKRPDLTEVTRQHFIEAFCEIYENKPVEKITVREIAERAGPNSGNTLERCKKEMLPVIIKAFSVAEDDYKVRAVFEFYLSGIVSLLKFKVECGERITIQELGKIVKCILQNSIPPPRN